MAKFIEYTVYTTHNGADLISDLLWGYTDSGVVIFDVEDALELSKSGRSWDYIDDEVLSNDKPVSVVAYFPIETADETISAVEREMLSIKQNSPFDMGSLETGKREIDGDLWRVQWKERFKPIHIGKVVIVPEWIKYESKEGEIPVYIDSNMAFGTGEHETTSMCVEFLDKYVKNSDVVLDVGCGSGILGITAKKLGANRVVMTDLDECAVTATERNIKLNGVENCEVYLKNLLDDTTVKGDVIAINIMAEVLIAFAPAIGGNLKKGGIIILSGILADRLSKVKSAYTGAGFTVVEDKIKGEWSALVVKGN